MANQKSQKRRVENELIFKQLNQQVRQAAEVMLPRQQRQEFPLNFYCECSDDKCAEKITVSVEDYKKLHQNSRHFVVLTGHQQPDIEQVVSEHDGYVVAEKDRELLEQVT